MSNWDDTKRTAQSPFHDELRSREPAAAPSQKLLTEQQEAQTRTWDTKHDELFKGISRTLKQLPAEHSNLSKTAHLMNAIRPYLEHERYLEREREKGAEVAISHQLLEENQQLKAINVELAEMLDNVVERGLIYWEPQTDRGAVAKAEMIEKASALITKAQQVHQPARQPFVPEPERDSDLEPDL